MTEELRESGARQAGGAEVVFHEPPQSISPSLDLDDWQLEDDLDNIRNLVGSFERSRVDTAHSGTQTMPPAVLWPARNGLAPITLPAPLPNIADESPRPARGSLIAWLTLPIGLMALMCGAVLLGWSWATARQELWQLGLPIAIAGQVLLLAGLILQLERIWQNSRSASRRLERVNEQLTDLKRATTMLSVPHSSAAQSFYAHMAEGASAQLLLADLKGQLDLLAVRMAQQR